MIIATQEEINKWEKENFYHISGWTKDFEKGEITFIFYDDQEHKFKIIE